MTSLSSTESAGCALSDDTCLKLGRIALMVSQRKLYNLYFGKNNLRTCGDPSIIFCLNGIGQSRDVEAELSSVLDSSSRFHEL